MVTPEDVPSGRRPAPPPDSLLRVDRPLSELPPDERLRVYRETRAWLDVELAHAGIVSGRDVKTVDDLLAWLDQLPDLAVHFDQLTDERYIETLGRLPRSGEPRADGAEAARIAHEQAKLLGFADAPAPPQDRPLSMTRMSLYAKTLAAHVRERSQVSESPADRRRRTEVRLLEFWTEAATDEAETDRRLTRSIRNLAADLGSTKSTVEAILSKPVHGGLRGLVKKRDLLLAQQRGRPGRRPKALTPMDYSKLDELGGDGRRG